MRKQGRKYSSFWHRTKILREKQNSDISALWPTIMTLGMRRNTSFFLLWPTFWSFQKPVALYSEVCHKVGLGFVFGHKSGGGGAFWFHKTFIFYDSIVWPSNQGRVFCRDSRCDNSSVTHDQDASTVLQPSAWTSCNFFKLVPNFVIGLCFFPFPIPIFDIVLIRHKYEIRVNVYSSICYQISFETETTITPEYQNIK